LLPFTRYQAQALHSNDNPYDLALSKTTFAELYQRWFNDNYDEESNRSTKKNYNTAFRHCAALHNMKMADIRTHHLQRMIDECTTGVEAAKRIRVLFNKLYKWCMYHECIKKNYAEYLTVPTYEQSTERRAFAKEHIALLWELADTTPNIPLALMLIYSGVRINELLDLKKEDVNLNQQWFRVRASKTAVGVRIVPIADKVLPYWKAYMARSQCEYAVCTPEGKHLAYDNFKKRYWYPSWLTWVGTMCRTKPATPATAF
jgi:site-specific recombinase XerD